jgi:outer membrane protein OmpA-like peptidoglycan-associated protein
VIKGYTDSVGGADYNRMLSRVRANVVKSYLSGKGIRPERIKVIGMGEKNPLSSNRTKDGRSSNRRVEVELAMTAGARES